MKKSPNPWGSNQEAGFTLIEVLLTMTILISLTGGAIVAIRNNLDIRDGLGEQSSVGHRLNTVMQKIVYDLEHTFILSTLAVWSNPVGRGSKTIFETESDGTLRMTTMTKHPLLKNTHESDQTLVVYKIADDRDHPGFKSLYRGETSTIPEDLDDEIPMEKLTYGIKKFQIVPWSGQSWHESRWSTNRNEHRNMLPRMVRVNIELIDVDPSDAGGKSPDELSVSQMSTVVYMPRSWGLKEYKDYSGTLSWN